MQERRRFPRRVVENETVTMSGTLNVQIIDISATGVLLQTTRPVQIGARGSLQMNLAGKPFAADIAVRRVAPVSGEPPRYRVGASFVEIANDHRRLIDDFVIQ